MCARNILVRLFLYIAPVFFGIFFDKRYFTGRWFFDNRTGWAWLLRALWDQKVLGFNRDAPIPINHSSKVSNWNNISFHPDNLDNFQSGGCYFQNYAANIVILRGVYIAPNVGIITTNHNSYNLDEALPGSDVFIGEKCWIGMNSVILPGVNLGPRTIVGAGSVVTRAFPEGNCVLVGSPARVVKRL
ncbi:MAG: acyltransferase [Candidatus Accumulibacter meliphilus]|jgi:acetyltransferase-like isoleucine patch superfamily enzyme|uniref:Acyltransferase n=1 Tax=Candidatus Accumulibacter meliphilus TaxID=2211374 RepID=A0A369XQQ6_9PROT|nr:MAG: acyltransferase [Candidatus Accumulibacter meliphilus]